MWPLMLACGDLAAPRPAGTEAVDAARPVATAAAGGTAVQVSPTFRRGPAVYVARGQPCRVERVDLEDGTTAPLFSALGACPSACAFEDRVAVCVEGERLVRHLYGGAPLVLASDEALGGATRVYFAADGAPVVLTSDGTARTVGPRGLLPVDVGAMPQAEVGAGRGRFDLGHPHAACLFGGCPELGPAPSVGPELGLRRPALLPLADGAGLLVDTGPDGEPRGPVYHCAAPSCASPAALLEDRGPLWISQRPPLVLVVGSEAHLVSAVPELPDRALGPVDWATWLPFDVQLPR